MPANNSPSLGQYIDHTLLRPEATSADIVALCETASAHDFFAVCVNSRFVPLAAKSLAGSPVRVCTVVGFPLGAMHSQAKAEEAAIACRLGADEIDMVVPLGAVMAADWNAVADDIAAVRKACEGRLLKVIFETCLLDAGQVRELCRLSSAAGADFVKTSTGFGSGGATLEVVKLMRESVAPGVAIKASGGIRDRATARAMIEAGASRLGTSSGVAIVRGERGEEAY